MGNLNIKTCPFCGFECHIETTTFGDSMVDYFRIKCNQHEHALDSWMSSIEEAIKIWNERK